MAQMAFAAGARMAAGALRSLAAFGVSSLFSSTRDPGSRVDGLEIQTSSEGAPVPRVYGRMRLAGQVIWASRFKETRTRQKTGGGKGGGPSVVEYSYSVSFAVALSEGPISGIGRVWANGSPLDTSRLVMRVYRGGEDQLPDPLIAMIEGSGAAPAYRGLAYVVFEDMPLDEYGARLPQLSFEVFGAGEEARPGSMESLIEGVCLIPASGEFAYGVGPVMREIADGRERAENVHTLRASSDIEAALDDLAMRLPNCKSVALVTSWFGDDLRCGECTIRPGVETRLKITRPIEWGSAGLTRLNAHLVTGGPAEPVYGGTPSDQTVIAAIQALKARGYKVVLYPFILMDVPPGNGLPDPYGGTEQAVFPWRGRITCHPAPGQPSTSDGSASAGAQVSAFFGSANASHFSVSGGSVSYSGPSEWRFARFILHHAALAAAAGGVEAFLIGSEMRGLTTVRSASGVYPATAHLKSIAAQARAILGGSCRISYAADWSEYWGHAPGGDERRFHLDPLWADPNIDFVGLDWYIPLADWREGNAHVDALAGAPSIHDPDYLASQVEGGEGYDWYYASEAGRESQTRIPITDGQGEPWIWRYKDLRSWWSEPHHERVGGVRSETPTDWMPRSKPVGFIEYGCPAVDKGANQPNVFIDPKSSESFAPYFSTRRRDDLIQRRYIEALLGYWEAGTGHNPHSPVYGGPMVDLSLCHAWTWDARPFPEFPARGDIWDDGANWALGHWLTGRVGQSGLARIVSDIAADAGLETIDTASLDGVVTGLVIEGGARARDVLAQLGTLYGFDLVDRAEGVAALARRGEAATLIAPDRLVREGNGAPISFIQPALAGRVREVRITHIGDCGDYQPSVASARGLDGAVEGVAAFSCRVLADPARARGWAVDLLAEEEGAGMAAQGVLPPSLMALEPGDVVILPSSASGPQRWRVTSCDGLSGRAARLEPLVSRAPVLAGSEPVLADSDAVLPPSRPLLAVMDLPLGQGEGEARNGLAVAAFASPWPGALSLFAGPDAGSATARAEITSPALMGRLQAALPPGPEGRWDRASVIELNLFDGALESATRLSVLAGANRIAIEGVEGWEVVQFADAELIAPGRWRLTGLLRGLGGSPSSGAGEGARVVVLDDAVRVLPVEADERGEALTIIAVPAGRTVDDLSARVVEAVYAGIDRRPLRPVHLHSRWQGGDLYLSWIRRTRIEGDAWGVGEVALGETSEAYIVRLFNAAGDRVLEREVTGPSALISAAELASALPGGTEGARWSVTQLSQSVGEGVVGEAEI